MKFTLGAIAIIILLAAIQVQFAFPTNNFNGFNNNFNSNLPAFNSNSGNNNTNSTPSTNQFTDLFGSLFNTSEGQDLMRELNNTIAFAVKNNTDSFGNAIPLQGSENLNATDIKEGLNRFGRELDNMTRNATSTNGSSSSSTRDTTHSSTDAPPENTAATNDMNNRVNSVVNSEEFSNVSNAFSRFLGLFRS